MRRAFCLVCLLAFACLLPRALRVGMAGDYVDAIGRITTQDEALYANSAITMARRGEWLTPRFMGRLALYKPPMLVWISAVSARLFGIARWSLRLPLVLIAALTIGLIFLWGAEAGGVVAGACAAVLLLGNHLFHTLSTLVMTDALLLAFTAAALFAIYSDPWLESRVAFWGYAAATAAAILTKGIAGFFPIAILALHWLAVRPRERPEFSRALLAMGLAMALAAPWFLYQLAVHPRGFWTEHIAVEILGFGAGASPQTSRENPVLFYVLRLTATDPILFSGVIVAIPAFLKTLRARQAGPILLACWLALTGFFTLVWQYRNASYLLALIPALALIAACYGPFAEQRHSSWMLGLVCLGLVVKAALPGAPWGLNYRARTVNPLAGSLTAYCEGPRAGSLIVVDMADNLYATLLPLPVRYVLVGPPPVSGSYGIDSTSPVGTLITAGSPQELDALVDASPDVDFLIPDRYRAATTSSSHRYVMAAPGFGFLMATRGKSTSINAWTCRM